MGRPVAAAFGAHVIGIAFLYYPIVPVADGGYTLADIYGSRAGVGSVPPEMIETQQRDNAAAAKAAIDRFATATARARVSADRSRPAPISLALASSSAVLRGTSISPLSGRPNLRAARLKIKIVEAALFDSGRPVIVVPYIQKAPLKLDRTMVCWDGSRAAARAIADAMPLLERAGLVEVVIIANERGKQDEIEGADMGQHLARHGLKVEVKRIDSGNLDVADALLSHAADSDVDFIVMGGYGHSRLREFVLGGVTRSILRTMTAPVLMSH